MSTPQTVFETWLDLVKYSDENPTPIDGRPSKDVVKEFRNKQANLIRLYTQLRDEQGEYHRLIFDWYRIDDPDPITRLLAVDRHLGPAKYQGPK